MTSRRIRKQQTTIKITNDLIERTKSVVIYKDEHGRWTVRCFDKRGRYIGGRNNTNHHDAVNSARLYMS